MNSIDIQNVASFNAKEGKGLGVFQTSRPVVE